MDGGGGGAIRIAGLASLLLLLFVLALPAVADSRIPAAKPHTHAQHHRHAKEHGEQSRREATRVTRIDFDSNAALVHAVDKAAAEQESGSGRSSMSALRRAPKQSGIAEHSRHGHDTFAIRKPPSPAPSRAGTRSTTRPALPGAAAVTPLQPSMSPTRSHPATEPSTQPASAVPSGQPQPSRTPRSLASILARPLHLSLGPLPIAIAIMLAAAGAGLVIMLSRTHRRTGLTTPAVATVGRHRSTRGNRSIEPIDAAR